MLESKLFEVVESVLYHKNLSFPGQWCVCSSTKEVSSGTTGGSSSRPFCWTPGRKEDYNRLRQQFWWKSEVISILQSILGLCFKKRRSQGLLTTTHTYSSWWSIPLCCSRHFATSSHCTMQLLHHSVYGLSHKVARSFSDFQTRKQRQLQSCESHCESPRHSGGTFVWLCNWLCQNSESKENQHIMI